VEDQVFVCCGVLSRLLVARYFAWLDEWIEGDEIGPPARGWGAEVKIGVVLESLVSDGGCELRVFMSLVRALE